jgi:hypothetical protein
MLRRGTRRIAVGVTAALVAAFAVAGLTTRSAPVGRAVMVTTVADAYVAPGEARLVASTDLDLLRARLAEANVSSDCCFAGVVPPVKQLLVAFSPATTACAHVTRVDARLRDGHNLQISTRLRACNPGPGGGSLPQGEELLVAFPLNELPTGQLTVNVSSHGDARFGTPPTSTALAVG